MGVPLGQRIQSPKGTMANDASFGWRFHADGAFSGLWDAMPHLPADIWRRVERGFLDATDGPLRLLLDNRGVGVAITSPDKRWIKVNDKYCEMIGYSREELASVDWGDVTHPDDLASNMALFKRLIAGEIRNYSLEKRYLRKNGEILHAEISVATLRRADGAIKYVLTLVVETMKRKLG